MMDANKLDAIDAMLAKARAEGGAFIDGEMLTVIAQCVAEVRAARPWLDVPARAVAGCEHDWQYTTHSDGEKKQCSKCRQIVSRFWFSGLASADSLHAARGSVSLDSLHAAKVIG